MTSANRPARLNRGLLGLLGILLVAAGGLLITAHFGAFGQGSREAAVVPGTEEPPRLVLYLVIAGAVVLVLAALRWLAAQFTRLPKSAVWQVGAADGLGRTQLVSSTAAEPVAVDVETYAGVRSATARLSGNALAPELHLLVTTDPTADLTALRRRILEHAVARLRTALDLSAIPVTVEFRIADRGRAARAR
ncbi:alkaline shock response membrane anchor protein AmaP [Nocardia sp. NPDC057272]|uniref:alkaline shock response membrane anchor protein AmaP n=1 Tax=Nocardia sp. NPDC057272 TaxID=3346079 RepID=UPI00362E436B